MDNYLVCKVFFSIILLLYVTNLNTIGMALKSRSLYFVCQLTQSEAKSADQAEQQQPPDLLQALLDCAETTALSQLLPHGQSAGHVHPAVHTYTQKLL